MEYQFRLCTEENADLYRFREEENADLQRFCERENADLYRVVVVVLGGGRGENADVYRHWREGRQC